MRTAIAIVMTMAAATLFGCQSPQGGGVSRDEGFKIGVPILDTKIKQGDSQTVNISLHRGKNFAQDVKLSITTTTGISVDPTEFLIRASEKPELNLRITAPRDAALREYRVHVAGTPQTGEPTTIDFTVKVVLP
jgi:uncharacterized membrane protein